MVNILGGSVRTIEKNTQGLLDASKEVGLEVNDDKTKYMGHVLRSECRRNSEYKEG